MNSSLLDQIAHAVLYEGYLLYPYRASSMKNQRERFTFGRVYPQAYSTAQNGAEPSIMQTECLVESLADGPGIEASVRFLQPLQRDVGVLAAPLCDWNEGREPDFKIVPELQVGETVYRTWQEAVEREVKLPLLNLRSHGGETQPFHFPASRTLEPIRDEHNRVVAVLLRETANINGAVEIIAGSLGTELFKVSIRITNLSPIAEVDLDNQDAVIRRTFASTHTSLHSHEASFISSMDPPVELKAAAAACRNIGTWPVLVGDEENANGTQCSRHRSSSMIIRSWRRRAPANSSTTRRSMRF